MGRLEDLKYKLLVIDQLIEAKGHFTYLELSRIIGLPETVLSRYVKGHVLPTSDRVEDIHKKLSQVLPFGEMLTPYFDHGVPDITRIRGNINLLKRAVTELISVYRGTQITKVMTARGDSTSFATLLAHSLGVDVTEATDFEESSTKAYYRQLYDIGEEGKPLTLFVPREDITKRDSILIASLLVRSGKKEKGMIDLITRSANARVTGIAGVMAIGDCEAELANVRKEFLYLDSSLKKETPLITQPSVGLVAEKSTITTDTIKNAIRELLTEHPSSSPIILYSVFRQKVPDPCDYNKFMQVLNQVEKERTTHS